MLTKQTFTVTLKEVERNPSSYLRRVKAGETVVILEDGKPTIEMKPTQTLLASPRPFGLCVGEFAVPDDFDAPLPEDYLSDFEG